MLVYGDPQFQAATDETFAWLDARLSALAPNNLDGVRAALIQAGQIEGAIADVENLGSLASDLPKLRSAMEVLTDGLASAFLAGLASVGQSLKALNAARAQLHAIIDLCASNRPLGARELSLKLPEGFEFYALFPEQFRAAALQWASAHGGNRTDNVVVVGVRGIGTTLSAVVTTTLKAAGWQAQRLTVRPGGHPFARQVVLPSLASAARAWALVVDEGPGLSGSSMAAVAQALVYQSFDPARICFFPSHSGEPGPAASPEVRAWWKIAPRFVTPLEQVRWPSAQVGSRTVQAHDDNSWLHCLRQETNRFVKGTAADAQTINVGGGLWRELAYTSEADWPAVATRFERPKYLCVTSSGDRILWKFIGLGAFVQKNATAAERALAQMSQLAKSHWVAPPLGTAFGFVAMPWIEGVRLSRQSVADDERLARHLAEYVAAAAGTPLTSAEQTNALERLAQMAHTNIAEALSDVVAARVREFALRVRRSDTIASFGDGRMAPHEWIRTASGKILKTDGVGHDTDHTIIGKQSVWWDVAGVLIEWDLSSSARRVFTEAVEARFPASDPAALAFYELAYAAFRLGQMALCLDIEEPDSAEAARLADARLFYGHAILSRVASGRL